MSSLAIAGGGALKRALVPKKKRPLNLIESRHDRPIKISLGTDVTKDVLK
jgi:hypothetical protein